MILKDFQLDQGYSWVIVICAFFLQVISIGITFTFGVIYIELLNVYKEDRSTTAWIGSFQSFFTYFTGLFAASLVKLFGWRTTTIAGSIISCLGFVLSSLVTSIYPLFFTYGVLTGFGNGLMYFSSMVSVQHYFDKRRALATGLAVSGSGIGMLFFSIITSKLIEKFQLKGTFLLEGFLMLIGVICGLFLKPVPEHGMGEDEERILLRVEPIRNEESISNKFANFIKDIFDFSICKNIKFVIFTTSFFIYAFGLYACFTYLPDMAREKFGSTESKCAALISIMGFANVCSRIIFAWIGDCGEKIRFYLGAFLLSGTGVVCVLVKFYANYMGVAIMAAFFGCFSGSWVSLFSVILVDIVNVDHIEKAMGIVCSVCSLAMLLTSPLGGWIIDKTNSFNALFYVIGFWQLYSGCLYLTMCFVKSNKQIRETERFDRHRYVSNRDSILRMSFS